MLTEPGIPTLDEVVVGDGAVTLAFTAPETDGGSAILSYEVAVIALDPSEANRTVRDVPPDATEVVVGDLVNGNEYQFRIRAVNAVGAGTYSTRSDVVVPTGPTTPTPTTPTPPTPTPPTPTAPTPTAPTPTTPTTPTPTTPTPTTPTPTGPATGDQTAVGGASAPMVQITGGTAAVGEDVASELGRLTDAEPTRLAGGDRYETAARIVERAFPGPVETVYVVTGENFPDALAGSAAAARHAAPVLLVGSSRVPDAIAEQLERLSPEVVKLVGGTSAVDEGVRTRLEELTGVTPQRVAGTDRYATAAAVVGDAFPANVDTVYLATGQHFPDALAGSAAAGALDAPVLLVGRGTLPEDVAEQLRRLAPEAVKVLGGDAAVSDELLLAVEDLTGADVQRIAGSDRYATSMEIVVDAFPDRIEHVYVATGQNFPDALAGSAAAAAQGAPMILVGPEGLSVDARQRLQQRLGTD